MRQAMKIPDAKAAVDKKMEEARNDPSLATGECQEQEGGYSGGTTRQREKSTLLHWWTYVTSKNAELERQFQKYRGRNVLRGDIVIDDSGDLCSFH